MSFKERWHREKARKAARTSASRGDSQALSIAFAWFSEDEWNKLTEVVPDRNDLDDTYQEWEKNAYEALRMLTNKGIVPVQVMVNVADLKAWCEAQGRPVDGAARAAYVAYEQRSRDEAATR